MAPTISPMASMAPSQTVAGTNKRMDATNSNTPTSHRPHGSIPTVENIKTDSGEAVNLK